MDINNLKLYNKYKDIRFSNTEFIYIGNDNENYYWFLYKNEDHILQFSTLKHFGFDPNKITKDLNIETYVDEYRIKYIKGCNYTYYSKENIEIFFKPILKDKLNNILNR